MNMKKSFVSAAVAVLGLCGMVAPAYSQMEDVGEIEPQVVLVEVTDITGDSAMVTANLLHAGSGAADGMADVIIEFSTDADVFEEGAQTMPSSLIIHSGVTAGTLEPALVDGLRPDRIYTARLAVENAGEQSAFTEPFTFRTLQRTQSERDISVACYAVTDEGVDFDIACGSAATNGTLLAAYGAMDGGSDTNDWEEVVVGGTIPANGGLIPWTWVDDGVNMAFFFRFFTVDGVSVGDSGTIYIDVNPYVVADEITEDGDRIAVSGHVVAEGFEDTAVVIEWNDGEAFDASAAQSRTVTGWMLGETFTEVIPATPLTNVWVRLVATDGFGGHDATAPVCLVTRGAALFGPSVAPSVSHRTVTYGGAIECLGAGDNILVLYAGPSADALVPVATNALDAAGSFSFVQTYPANPQTLYYAFLARSETQAGSVFEAWSATNSVETKDEVTYTWKADVYEGDWNDPANWTPDAHAGDCVGYPNHASSAASFLNCVAAHPVTVHVNGKYTVGNLKYYGSGASDITFAGTGPAESELTAGQNDEAIQANSTVAFRDMTLVRAGSWEIMRDNAARTNITVRFSHAVTTGSGHFSLATPHARFEFLDGTVATGAGKFNVGGSNTVFVVDDSTVSMPGEFHFNADNGAAGPVALVIRGRNAKVASASTFYIYSHAQGHPVNVAFEIPKGGYAEPPIQLTGSESFGGGENFSGTSTFHFEVSPVSPALTQSRARLDNRVMVRTEAGVNAGKVAEGIGTTPPYRGAPCGAFRYDDATAPKAILLSVKGWGPPPTILTLE